MDAVSTSVTTSSIVSTGYASRSLCEWHKLRGRLLGGRFGGSATLQNSFDGTSYSAAFVSGLLAVLMSNYAWTRDQAIAAVLARADSTDVANPAYYSLLGAGRVNA